MTSMQTKAAIAALALVAALAGAGSASAKSLPSPVKCGDTLTHSVKLTADLTDCPGDGLVIGADGITVDLNGHTIDGTVTQTTDCDVFPGRGRRHHRRRLRRSHDQGRHDPAVRQWLQRRRGHGRHGRQHRPRPDGARQPLRRHRAGQRTAAQQRQPDRGQRRLRQRLRRGHRAHPGERKPHRRQSHPRQQRRS